MTDRDPDYLRGRELFDNFVRGDAMIGLVADIPGTEREMMTALWAAAGRGSTPAYRTLAEIHLAALRPLGAFEGVGSDDAERPWSEHARAIVDDNTPLESAMRGFAEAGRLGDREALRRFVGLTRHASPETQRLAAQRLAELADPSAADLHQRGLCLQWLGEHDAAFPLHLQAAEQGDGDAMFELHVLYGQGLGVEVDVEASTLWLDRAAAADHPRALYNLGAAYASGQRGAPDMAAAAKWYGRAADRGNGRAAATLAVMVLTGELDGTRDQACAWLDQADALGYESWQILDAVGLDDPRVA